MKRKFYTSYDTGKITFDPPVEDHQVLLLEDYIPADKMAQLPTVDDDDLVERYCKAEAERYAASRAIWDNRVPAEEEDND